MSKACAVCYDSFGEEYELDEVLDHYNEDHWSHDVLVKVLSDTKVHVECSNCGLWFIGQPGSNPGGFHAEAYCPDCREVDGLKAVMSQPITAEHIIEYEA